MDEKNKIIAKTYRFYTNKGQRIAAYCWRGDSKLIIGEIRCSRKDHFEKWKADAAFQEFMKFPLLIVDGVTLAFTSRKKNAPIKNVTFHPVIHQLEISDTPKKQFLEFMTENYYRLWEYPQKYAQEVLRHYGSKSHPCIPFGKPKQRTPKMSDFI